MTLSHYRYHELGRPAETLNLQQITELTDTSYSLHVRACYGVRVAIMFYYDRYHMGIYGASIYKFMCTAVVIAVIY